MKNFRFCLMLAAPTIVVAGALCFADFPLGIPGEWVWSRLESPGDLGLTLGVAGFAALLFAGFVWAGATRLPVCQRSEVALWLVGLLVVGFGWLHVAQESAPADYRLSKVAWVLFYPGSSGYFSHARDEGKDFDQFLVEYETLMSEGDVLHVGTHPPGLFMGYHWLIKTCKWFPTLSEWLTASEPASLSDAFDVIKYNHRGTPSELLPEHRAAVWLAALLTQLAAVATMIPLYLLLRRDFSRETAWLAVSLWPTVPALALFLPKSDVLYSLLGVLFLFAWLTGWETRSAVRCFLAGFVLCLGLTCSLALLPIHVLVALLTLWRGWICQPGERVPEAMSKLLFAKSWAAVGFLLPAVTLWASKGVNLLNVWIWNYRNHASFYDEYPRTYWKWLLVNPLEFCVAVGLPLALLAMLGGWRTGSAPPRSRRNGIVWASLAVWGLLWLSGKNMGELARLWIVVMPPLILLAAACFSGEKGREEEPVLGRWLFAFLFQLGIGIVMLMTVHGFDFPDM